MLNIYVGSYKGYNDGILDGAWLNLPMDDSEMWETIYSNCVEGAEEFGIFDFESDIVDDIGEYDDIDDINAMADELDAMGDEKLEIVGALLNNGCDISEAIDRKDDCVYWGDMDLAEIAEEYYTDSGYMDSNNPLMNYIDWDAVGRDMGYEGYFIESPNGKTIEILY